MALSRKGTGRLSPTIQHVGVPPRTQAAPACEQSSWTTAAASSRSGDTPGGRRWACRRVSVHAGYETFGRCSPARHVLRCRMFACGRRMFACGRSVRWQDPMGFRFPTSVGRGRRTTWRSQSSRESQGPGMVHAEGSSCSLTTRSTPRIPSQAPLPLNSMNRSVGSWITARSFGWMRSSLDRRINGVRSRRQRWPSRSMTDTRTTTRM